jgi:putative heme-binding domain-containing protein
VAYTADAALGANIPVWKPAYEAGDLAAATTPAGRILESVLGLDKKAAEIAPLMAVLGGEQERSAEERNKAMQALADIEGGSADRGKVVFRRVCINCHRIYGEGADLGPDMNQVGKRLAPVKLVESIIDPNAEVDAKYLSTLVITDEGKSITGLLVSETPDELVIHDGKEPKTIPVASIEERVKLKQSSMPEGLAATLSPNEFLDVIAFLRSLK